MIEFRTGPIEAKARNAADIRRMVLAEAEKFSSDTSRVKSIKDQEAALAINSHMYLGTFDDTDRLVAFAKFNDWRRADQIAFESLGKQIRYKFDRNKSDQELPGKPMGIFALSAFEALSMDEAILATGLLVDDIIEEAGDHQIRMARYAHTPSFDPSWWATNRRGFESTGKFGHVNGVLQELAIHDPSTAQL